MWAIRRDDGAVRPRHFSLRAIAENNDGHQEVVLRGIIRWLDDPLPDLRWRHDIDATEQPWIHTGDQDAADPLSMALSSGRTTGVNCGWPPRAGTGISVAIVANIVLLDQHTTAALFIMHRA